MKKNILLLLMLPLFFIAADAQAHECPAEKYCCPIMTNFYAEFFGGANFLENSSIQGNHASYQTGYILAGSLGYSWHYGLHLEFEYAFRKNAIKQIHFVTEGSSNHGNLQTSSFMANLLWDLPSYPFRQRFWNIQPLIGVGIGYDIQQMNASNSRIVFNQKWDCFSWQVMAGLSRQIFRNTELTVEYKFHQGDHFNNNSIGAGLIYKFGFIKPTQKTARS